MPLVRGTSRVCIAKERPVNMILYSLPLVYRLTKTCLAHLDTLEVQGIAGMWVQVVELDDLEAC